MFSTFGAQRNTAKTKGRTLALKRCKMALKRRKFVQKAGDNRNILFCKVLPNWQRILHSIQRYIFFTEGAIGIIQVVNHRMWFLANKKLLVWGWFIHVYTTHFYCVMTGGKDGGESMWIPHLPHARRDAHRGNQCVAYQADGASIRRGDRSGIDPCWMRVIQYLNVFVFAWEKQIHSGKLT